MIVVEGPDGSGKTTLAHQLAKHYSIRVHTVDKEDRTSEFGPPKRSARERVWEALGVAVTGHEPVVIHDRLLLSELVYGPIVRHSLEFGGEERRLMEFVFAALHIPVIICLPPQEVVAENIKEHEQYAPMQQTEIYRAYKQYSIPPGLNAHYYDYTRPLAFDWVTRKCDRYMEQRRMRSW